MRLLTARVKNFRCVEDSETFALDQVTCLVGKNEAGKTALLQALWRLNPHAPAPYDVERDYPRRFYADYEERHSDGRSQVLDTEWGLDDADLTALNNLLGPAASKSVRNVRIFAYMGATQQTWSVGEIPEPKVVAHILGSSTLHDEEKTPLSACVTISALKEAVEKMATNERIEALKCTLAAGFKRGTAALAVIDLLSIPKFVYFSSYDIMKGRVHLDSLVQRVREKQSLDASQALFLSFCEFAGTSLEELVNIDRFEKLKAKFEGAQAKITEQIFEYWTSNQYLRVEFSKDVALPKDDAPFNAGHVFNVRIWNDLHQASVPFDERSAGFVWFFSFLVLFTQVRKRLGNNLILLLDEPGLNLHAKAQGDLLRFFEETLAPNHQVIYTTHSLFMVPPDRLESVRIVEDVLVERKGRKPEVKGTKVKTDVLEVTQDTLFPLQGALGFEITQTLFVGKYNLMVEGPSDLLYLTAVSHHLKELGRKGLDRRWTICPVGGVDKVPAFIALFHAQKLNLVALLDLAKGTKGKVEAARKQAEGILRAGRVLTYAQFVGHDADVEDMFGVGYIDIVNDAYGLTPALSGGAGADERILPWVEGQLRVHPAGVDFSHYGPAEHLLQNRKKLMAALSDRDATLLRFETLFEQLNSLLK